MLRIETDAVLRFGCIVCATEISMIKALRLSNQVWIPKIWRVRSQNDALRAIAIGIMLLFEPLPFPLITPSLLEVQ